MSAVFRTGYLVSFASFIVFFVLEWLRPGFVTHVFSVHWFLFSAVVFGVLWMRSLSSTPVTRFQAPAILGVSLLSILFAVFAWVNGQPFEDLRLLVTLAAFMVPWVVFGLLKPKR